MKTLLLSLIVSLFMLQLTFQASAEGKLSPSYLRVEYRTNPLGIDVTDPRLSWLVESSERGQRQSAFRVLVARCPERLKTDQGDLWDSGKVESDATTAIVYQGKILIARTRCFWKVMVWDTDGQASGWSRPAEWSIGLLENSDWKGQWIGYDRPATKAKEMAADPLAGANWIWYPEGEPAKSAPVGRRFFRREFLIPAGRRLTSAQLIVASDNRCSGYVNGVHVGDQSGFTAAKRMDVTARLAPGKNVIAIGVTNDGDNPNPAGLLGVLYVQFDQGKPLLFVTDASWMAAQQNAQGWRVGKDAETEWVAVKNLVPNGGLPWKQKVVAPSLRLPPPRYLRTEFALDKPISRATIYGSAQGLYQLHLNGQRVGKDYFSPGWTDYDQRIYYQTYDVTDLVRSGRNGFGAVLADGWFAGHVGFGGGRDHYGDRIRLLAQLEIEFEDGSTQIVATGPDWQANTGPLVEADFLMGEHYDARRELPGWDGPGFDDSGWHAVDTTPTQDIPARVQAHPGVPVRAFELIRPIKIYEPIPGRFVIDMGQNFAGMVRLRVRGENGRRIQIRHAERLNPDGTIYTANLRSARATDTYVCRGDENGRWWQPRFSFQGFQYVEVTGYPGQLSADDLVGVPVSSATPIVGSFECSDPMVNKLFSNIYWTQRMNFIDIPTDCPQRDERLGWTGDAQIYVRTASMICDIQAFFTKWLIDLDDAQREDGQYPMVAPLKSKGVAPDGGPAWADAGVICPWNIYEVYGDKRLLRKHYDGMAKFIVFCKNRSTPDLLPPEKFHCFGDWLNIDDNTPTEVIYTAYFAYSTDLVRRAAQALGKTDDAAKYDALRDRIKAAFNKVYVKPNGRIEGDTQTAYVLALAFDLVDGKRRETAAQRLVELIEGRNGHLSTGFIGTKDLMLVLSKIGRDDVAYRLLHNTTFPSWGFSIRHGATSIWERWNGWTPAQGFFDPGMNSFAHYSFGAVAQWMFETIGGIHTDGPGFKRIVIHPKPGGKITWAKVSYRSIRGPIATEWKIEDGLFTLNVVIPANTTAEVHVPIKDGSTVTESGRAASEAPGVQLLRTEDGTAVYSVTSGCYSFVAD